MEVNSKSYPERVEGGYCWWKIAEQYMPYGTMNAHLASIEQKIAANVEYVLSDAEATYVKEAFVSCNKFFAGRVVTNLTKLPLGVVKEAVFQALLQDNEAIVRACLERYLTSLEEKKFIQFSGVNSKLLDDILEKSMALRDKALEGELHGKATSILKEMYYETSYFCHHLIETFISFAGFNEIGGARRHRFQEGEMSSYEAKAKVEIYLALLAYPSIVFFALLSIMGSTALAGITAGCVVIATILFIPVYLRHLRPCPNQYSGLSNLNQKIMRRQSPPTFHRVDILDRIQNAFCAGKGVILTGDPGSGKTSIAESFAAMIVEGQAKKGVDFLNGAQMFSTNANQFKDVSSIDSLNFQDLAEKFKGREKSFVLFVDEIASLYEKGAFTGNSVKSFLTFLDKFPNVICATTSKEYDAHIKNDDPINRRLVHIEVNPLTQKELIATLFQYLHYKAPELIVEEGAIPYIIEKANAFNPKTSQIDGAMSLLKRAIINATQITFADLEKKVTDLKLEIECLEEDLLHSDQSGVVDAVKDYQRKKKDLKSIQEQLFEKTKVLDQVKKIEALHLKVKKQGYVLATKSTTQSAINSRKWVVNHATQQILADFLMHKRKELGIPKGLDKGLIDDIVSAQGAK